MEFCQGPLPGQGKKGLWMPLPHGNHRFVCLLTGVVCAVNKELRLSRNTQPRSAFVAIPGASGNTCSYKHSLVKTAGAKLPGERSVGKGDAIFTVPL